MKKFRISSTTNLHARREAGADVLTYLGDELVFQKEMGFDAIDINLDQFDYTKKDWRDTVLAAAKLADEIGIRFEISHLPFIQAGAKLEGEVYEAFRHRKMCSIEAAKLIGVSYAVMHPNGATIAQKTYNEKEQFDNVMKYLSPFAEYAAKLGVNTVVENMRVYPSLVASRRYAQTPEELCRLADALGIGCCWDFGHANISGLRQSEAIEYLGSRLRVLHINDNFGINDDHIPPFVGNVDWKDAMKGISKVGFEGLFNFEIATGKVPNELRPALAKYLAESAKTLMSYVD